MFQRILVPLDGSTRAERAIPVAARLTHASGGSLILMRVLNKSSRLWPSMTLRTPQAQRAIDNELAEVEQYLSAIANSADLEEIPTETDARFGPTVSSILVVADATQADLIVLCSHGYTGMTRRIIGSVAEKLAREASVPVLVLRDEGPVPGELHADSTRPLRALVPLDGSAYAKSALEPAAFLIAALAGPAPGILHLLRVVQPVNARIKEGGMLTASEKARRYLSATADHIREGFVAPTVAQLNLAVTWSVAVDTYVAESLVRTAENAEAMEELEGLSGCDVIALATHGRDGFQRMAIGSVTGQILADTKLPLLIVPPRSQRVTIQSEPTAEANMGLREQSWSNAFSPV
ncbi:MAG: universal stress protein [Ktedonobacteraceae bacterium]